MRKTLILLLTFISCNYANRVRKSDCYLQLKSEVSDNWRYQNDSLYFKVNPVFLKKIDSEYKQCFQSFKKENLVELLGLPTVIEQWPSRGGRYACIVKYLVTIPYKPHKMTNGEEYKRYITFNLDSEDYVREVGIEGHFVMISE